LDATFSDGEDQPGRDHVAILSHDLWERRFGSDTSLIGRTIRLNRENYTVYRRDARQFQFAGIPASTVDPTRINRRRSNCGSA